MNEEAAADMKLLSSHLNGDLTTVDHQTPPPVNTKCSLNEYYVSELLLIEVPIEWMKTLDEGPSMHINLSQ